MKAPARFSIGLLCFLVLLLALALSACVGLTGPRCSDVVTDTIAGVDSTQVSYGFCPGRFR